MDRGGLSQPFGDGGGHRPGDRVGVVEFRLVAGDAQRDGLSGRQEAFPGQAGGAFLEFGEGGGVEEIAQAGQDAAGGAQVQVGAVEGGQVAFEGHATGFGRTGYPQRIASRSGRDRGEFLGGEGFQSGGGDGEIRIHSQPFSPQWTLR